VVITIKLFGGDDLEASDDGVTLVAGPYPHDVGPFTHVYGPGVGAIVTEEAPQLVVGRLSTRADFAVLKRPNGTPVWIHAPSVSMVRPPTREEEPVEGKVHAVLAVGEFHQAVQEAVPIVLQILQGHNARIA
jgi:hypothetical protein